MKANHILEQLRQELAGQNAQIDQAKSILESLDPAADLQIDAGTLEAFQDACDLVEPAPLPASIGVGLRG